DVAAVSPDGKRMTVIGEAPGKKVMSDGDYCLRVFDFPTGKELARFKLEYEWGRDSLAYSPDGKTLACGGERGCSLIDPATGTVLRRLTGRAMRVSFSPDGKLLAAAAGPRLRLWDMTAKRELHDQFGDFPAPVCRDPYIPQAASAVSADGRLVAAVDAATRDLMLWDTTNERLVRRIPLNGKEWYLQELAFTADGQGLVARTGEGFIRAWEIATGAERKAIELNHTLLPLADPIPQRLSPDGRWVLTADPERNEAFAIWDTTNGKVRYRHPLQADDWMDLGSRGWSVDGSTMVLDGKKGLAIIAVESGRVRARLPGGIHSPRSGAAISAGGRLVAAWKEPQAADQKDERLAVWEVATGKEVAIVPAGSARHLAFGLGGRVLVVNDDVKGLRVWDLATGQERPRFPDAVPRSKWWYSRAQGLLTTPDGMRAVAVQPDGTALVWDLAATAPSSEKWTRKQLAAWWVDLASADAGRAWRAIWRLAEVPSDDLVPFLRNSLKPTTPNAAAVRRLIADLDAADFTVRDKASRELVRQGPEVIPAVRQALKDARSGEARQRLETILKRLEHHRLRPARLVAVLERVGSAGARKLLTELAGGPADAPETREAKAALRRLSK
ncbi:MAG TPA: hypothetical protein VFG68_16120, partial [Fimbriiglobus sp.]|nr:hypothetical protein [Fimbriiglobus sp.]